MAGRKKTTKGKADPEKWKFSAEEQERATRDFSYDVKSLGRLSGGDDWSIFVQAHLYLDHVITKMLEEELRHPENIDLDRIAFAAKLDLCAALGLIEAQVKGLLRYVNSVRNKLAHDLSFKISTSVAARIYALSGDGEKNLMDERRELWPTEPVLYHYLTTILVTLDIRRQGLADWREEGRSFRKCERVTGKASGRNGGRSQLIGSGSVRFPPIADIKEFIQTGAWVQQS